MTKILQKSVILSVVFGLLLAVAAPSAMAQDRCRKRGNYARFANNYQDDDYYRDRSYQRDRRRRDRDYDDDYYDRENTTGKAIKRTGIGAGIGALGGALIGGKKGALIGAAIGAGGGYLYHRKKVDDQRNRRYRY
ncbi:MAG: YMGG-like glycine zipper-containing protein [Blastocatellales bacterium]